MLDKLFRATLSSTVHEEIQRVRLERAKQLLTQTDLPLKTGGPEGRLCHRTIPDGRHAEARADHAGAVPPRGAARGRRSGLRPAVERTIIRNRWGTDAGWSELRTPVRCAHKLWSSPINRWWSPAIVAVSENHPLMTRRRGQRKESMQRAHMDSQRDATEGIPAGAGQPATPPYSSPRGPEVHRAAGQGGGNRRPAWPACPTWPRLAGRSRRSP